jgi:hypothetical protein
MTKLLEKAFAQAGQLPEQEQLALATLILEEIASERRWQVAFENSAEQLSRRADEALAEYHQGRTELLDPDRL